MEASEPSPAQNGPRILAVVYEYADLLNALRNRRDELQVSHTTIDDVSGLSSGYSSKVLCDPPIKGLGPVSLGPMLGVLGIKILLVEDYEMLLRVQKQFTKRIVTGAAVTMMARMRANGTQNVVTANFLRRIAGRGGDMRAYKLSRRKQSAIARKAARARWHKPRVVAIAGSDPSPSAT
jgi:hypothetical protein